MRPTVRRLMGSLLLMTLLVGVPSTAVADGARPLPAASRPLPLGPARADRDADPERGPARGHPDHDRPRRDRRRPTSGPSRSASRSAVPPDPDTPREGAVRSGQCREPGRRGSRGRLRARGWRRSPHRRRRTTPAAPWVGGSGSGNLASKAESDAVLADLVAAGFTGSSRFTGWDGSSDRPRPVAAAGPDDRSARVLRAAARLVRTEHRGPGDDERAQPGRRRDRGGQRRLLRPRPARRCARRPGRRRGVRRPVAQRDDRLPSGAGVAGRRPADAGGPAALGRHGAGPDRSAPARRDRPGPGPDPQLRRPRRPTDDPAAARLHLHRRRRAGRLHARVRRGDPGRGRTSKRWSTSTPGSSHCVRRAAGRCRRVTGRSRPPATRSPAATDGASSGLD